MNRMQGFGICIIAAVLVCGGAVAADWPQFCGPNRDNISHEKGLARNWPEGGPKLLWRIPLGTGFASPSVAAGRVYVLDRPDDKQDVLRCLSLQDGKELWNFAYDAPGTPTHTGSRTAPTIDGKYLYTVGIMGDLYCVDIETHKPVWNKNLCTDFKVAEPMWGVAQAPSIYGDLLIVAPQAPDAYVVAYKKATGELVWKSQGLGLLGYTTPVVAKLAGVDQVIMAGSCNPSGPEKGTVAAFSLKDGSILWRYENWQNPIPIPFPTALPNDRLFITGGYKGGSAMLQIAQKDGKLEAKELFKTDDSIGSQIQQPLLIGQYLYMNSNSNDQSDGMECVGLDGQIKWKTKGAEGLPNFGFGPILYADNLIFNLDGDKGILHLIEPSPDGYKELAQAKLLDGKEIWSPMALVDGKLLIRSQSEMKCLGVKNP